MLIFTAHTPAYLEYAERLAQSCETAGHRLVRIGMSDRGSWERNCAQKALICRRMREVSKGSILWLDADAEILGNVDGLDALCEGFDLAHGVRLGREVLSGTLWIGDTPGARSALDVWVSKCVAFPHVWDQKHLAAAIEETGAKALGLDPGWCFIDRISEREHPGVAPIIYHHQASRVMKARVTK